VKKAQLSLF